MSAPSFNFRWRPITPREHVPVDMVLGVNRDRTLRVIRSDGYRMGRGEWISVARPPSASGTQFGIGTNDAFEHHSLSAENFVCLAVVAVGYEPLDTTIAVCISDRIGMRHYGSREEQQFLREIMDGVCDVVSAMFSTMDYKNRQVIARQESVAHRKREEIRQAAAKKAAQSRIVLDE